jgi:hypothetical protein
LIQRFTSGIAGIMPRSLSRKSSRDGSQEDQDAYTCAMELLVLGFAICAASPSDCLRFARVASPLDRVALKRLLELASHAGLVGPGSNCPSSPEECAKAFLLSSSRRSSAEGIPSASDRKKDDFRSRGKSRSNVSGASDFSDTSFTDFSKRAQGFRIPPPRSHLGVHSFLDFITSQDESRSSSKSLACSKPQAIRRQNSKWGNMPVVVGLDIASFNSGSGGTKIEFPPGASKRTEDAISLAGHSESAQTYHSVLDAVVVGEGGERETVNAEVVNLGGESPTQVKIEFKSQCLRTQNEWQRQLLLQQRSLVDAMTTRLESTEEVLRTQGEVQEEEKELLRSFRKIVTREIDTDDNSIFVQIYVVDKNREQSQEIQELCDILDFPCQVFRSLTAAKDAIDRTQMVVGFEQQKAQLKRAATTRSCLSHIAGERSGSAASSAEPPAATKRSRAISRSMTNSSSLTAVTSVSEPTKESKESSPKQKAASPFRRGINRSGTIKSSADSEPATRGGLRRSGTSKSTFSKAADGQVPRKHFLRSGTSKSVLSRLSDGLHSVYTSSSHSSGTSCGSEGPIAVQIVLLGSEWLDRELPSEWSDSTVYVTLTSQPEEFEAIGKTLLAADKTEMLESLDRRGISDYVMHPLSLDGIRRLGARALCKHFGHEYLLTKVVGRGSSGVVYRAKRLRDGKIFALKEINTMRLSKTAQSELQKKNRSSQNAGMANSMRAGGCMGCY